MKSANAFSVGDDDPLVIGTGRKGFAGGFTLIEMMLVVLIVGIVTAITAPVISGSLRGAKLRTAAANVVKAGRYARSMAIMRQSETTLSIDPGAASLSVAGAGEDMKRKLDGVGIEVVTVEGGSAGAGGVCSIPFTRNGRCLPYVLRVFDARDSVLITVDALGGARTEKGYR